MSRPDSNSTVEVEGQVMMTTSVDMSSSSGEMSELQNQNHGNILIDEYGIPEDPSHTSSEIMARLTPRLDHDQEGMKLVWHMLLA